jgi:Spy/CpxP family protein refolding chaperone
MSRRIVCVLGSACLIALMTTSSWTQEMKAKKKATGRLPPHYAAVVTPEQRTRIYSIQAKYAERIQKLADEMKALTEQRDAEVEGVLTAEQKQKIESLRAESRRKSAPAADPADAAAAN